jgi:multidrug efflux system outer membrane protein
MGSRGASTRCCIGFLGLLASSPGGAQPLTLEGALAAAAAGNEIPAIAAERIEAASAVRRLAVTQLVPALTLGGNYTRRQREVTRVVDEEELTIQARDALAGQAVVEALLFDLRALPLIRSTTADLEAQRFESRELERALAFDVADTFYAVLSSEELLAAARQRVEVARSTAEEAAIRLDAGLAARNELTRTRLELATAERAETEAANLVRSSRLALGYLIAEPVGDRPLVAPRPAPAVEQDAGALVEQALAGSQELAALEERALAAHQRSWVPRLGLVPTLDLRGLYRTTNESGLSGADSDWNVAVNLTWELFDGGSRQAEAMRLAAVAREADLVLAQRRREVALDVEQALADVATAEAALAQAAVQGEVAEQNAEEVRERFQQGLATGLELADALVERFAAAAEVARQGFARRLAQLALESALGLWPGGVESPSWTEIPGADPAPSAPAASAFVATP